MKKVKILFACLLITAAALCSCGDSSNLNTSNSKYYASMSKRAQPTVVGKWLCRERSAPNNLDAEFYEVQKIENALFLIKQKGGQGYVYDIVKVGESYYSNGYTNSNYEIYQIKTGAFPEFISISENGSLKLGNVRGRLYDEYEALRQ